ncbi:MAG: response regulator transcription factor [Litorimonas sp.]
MTRMNEPRRITIGILEDSPDMQAYLEHILSAETGVKIAFIATTLAEAMAHINQGDAPDICLVDLDLPDGNGADFVSHITQKTECKALILTVLGDKVSVMSGFSSGAHGYLLKDSEPAQIMQHILDTLAGANPISARVSTHLLAHYLGHQTPAAPAPEKISSTLTKRETETLTLFAKGMSYKETAEILGISTNTISDHVKSIYGKLYVNSRNEAVFEALQMGWIKV